MIDSIIFDFIKKSGIEMSIKYNPITFTFDFIFAKLGYKGYYSTSIDETEFFNDQEKAINGAFVECIEYFARKYDDLLIG